MSVADWADPAMRDIVFTCSTPYVLHDEYPFGRGFQKSVWIATVSCRRLAQEPSPGKEKEGYAEGTVLVVADA